jgi:AcrR family transcriptional regulator
VGVSANATYRHFANKEALLSALAAEGFRRLQAAETKAAAQLSRPDAGFRATGRAYVQFAIDNPALFRLMFGHFTLSQKDPELLEASMAAFQSTLNILAGMIGLPPNDPRVLLNALVAWSTVHGLSHLVLSRQLDLFGDVTDQLIDAVVTDVPLWMTVNK